LAPVAGLCSDYPAAGLGFAEKGLRFAPGRTAAEAAWEQGVAQERRTAARQAADKPARSRGPAAAGTSAAALGQAGRAGVVRAAGNPGEARRHRAAGNPVVVRRRRAPPQKGCRIHCRTERCPRTGSRI